MITAKIVLDSLSPLGIRLTTLQLKYPRFIHAEFLTHRVFSRNSSSSRAIPSSKNIAWARERDFPFVHVGKNQPGMQSREEISPEIKEKFTQEWFALGDIVASYVERWSMEYDIHKQVANRALEPWTHIHVVVTSTEWENFFKLRAHDAAQPEIQALAVKMREAMQHSSPMLLSPGKWHLPYVRDEERRALLADRLRQVSAARCARVSYVTHDGSAPVIAKDVDLFWKLVGAEPIHASPTEHQATPDTRFLWWWRNKGLHGNFRGWIQHRKLIEIGKAQEPNLQKVA